MLKRVHVNNLYHVSYEDLDGETLIPRIPDNLFTEMGWEDNKRKRVCFAERVGGCLSALSRAVKGRLFNVYSPDDIDLYRVYKPSIEQVPDVELTGELWIVKPVKVNLVGKIMVTDYDNVSTYHYGGNRKGYVYRWNFEWVERRDVSIDGR